MRGVPHNRLPKGKGRQPKRLKFIFCSGAESIHHGPTAGRRAGGRAEGRCVRAGPLEESTSNLGQCSQLPGVSGLFIEPKSSRKLS